MTLLLVSCSSRRQIVEIPIEVVRTEYKYDSIIDSVYIRDSVDRYIKGDTVFLYKERIKYRYLSKVDTIVKTDTIPKVVKVESVEQVVVNHIKWYQKILMYLGGLSSIILLIWLICKFKFRWI